MAQKRAPTRIGGSIAPTFGQTELMVVASMATILENKVEESFPPSRFRIQRSDKKGKYTRSNFPKLENPCKFKIELQRLHNVNLIATVKVVNQADCIGLCLHHQQCVSVTIVRLHVQRESLCMLSSSAAKRYQLQPFEHGIYLDLTCAIHDLQVNTPHISYRTATSILPHPRYTPNGRNDIALIKLRSRLQFNDYIRPLCLPAGKISSSSGLKCIICGYGHGEGI
uniref:Apple domain-containing protein n=1 Tax=Romanomermis culicivorax TaxID=13658 RepID=A0A915I3I3_ROMCU